MSNVQIGITAMKKGSNGLIG